MDRVVFYRKRSFTRAEFRRFIFAQSTAFPEMLELVAQLKVQHGLKIAVVSNEARELNAYRIRSFKRDRFVVEVAAGLCIRSILHEDAQSARAQLASLG